MKEQRVSPAMAAVAIVVVLAVVGFLGYRVLGGGNRSGVSDSSRPATPVQSQRMSQQYQNYGQQRGGGSGTGAYNRGGSGAGSSSSYGAGGPPAGYQNQGGAAGAYGGR